MLEHLADVSLRSLLLALLAEIALAALGNRRTAALQHAVWTSVMCGMLVLLAFGHSLPRLPVRVSPRLAAPAPAVVSDVTVYREVPDVAPEAPSRPLPARRSLDWRSAILYLYSVIAVALLGRFAIGSFLVRRLLARSTSAGSFLASERIAVPLTIGWLRPRIVLPLEWREWGAEKLETVLAHESAHVRRHDGLVAALAGVNRCLFSFHPLAWFLERKLALLAEQACDESCVAVLGDCRRYANLLIEMALVVDRSHGRLRHHALTMAAGPHIRRRIDSLLKEGRTFSRGLSRAGWAAVMLCGIPLVWSAGAVQLDREAVAAQVSSMDVVESDPELQVPVEQPTPAHVDREPQAPAVATQSAPAQSSPQFEVASIKVNPDCREARGGRGGGPDPLSPSVRWTPLRLELRCRSLEELVQMAYVRYASGIFNPMPPSPIEGGPAWMSSERYMIEAGVESAQSQGTMIGPMLRALLENRFQLKIRRETREIPVYELVVAPGGPKLTPFQGKCNPDPNAPSRFLSDGGDGRPRLDAPCGPDGQPVSASGFMTHQRGPNSIADAPGISLQGLCQSLLARLDRPVIDKTGIHGLFDIHLEFADDTMARLAAANNAPPGLREQMLGGAEHMNDPPGPSIFESLQKQLGLKLVKAQGPGTYLVVDHVERPSEN